jgi:hypothetical protein
MPVCDNTQSLIGKGMTRITSVLGPIYPSDSNDCYTELRCLIHLLAEG